MLEKYGITLFKHQRELTELNPAKYLLPHSCGTGKTISLIALIKKNNINNEPVIIISIKSDKDKWIKEAKKFEINATVMTKEEFKKEITGFSIKRAYDPKKKEVVDVKKVVNKPQQLQRFNYFIYDEVHFATGMTSQTYKSLVAYLKYHQPDYIWIASGTPYSSTPWNLFCLGNILGYNWDYKRFRNHFFEFNRFIKVGKFGGVWQPKKIIEGRTLETEIGRYIRFLGKPVEMEDCVDMPPRVFQEEYFDFSPEQKRYIKEVMEEYRINKKLGKKDCVLRKNRRLHQINGGVLYETDRDEDNEIDNKHYRTIKTPKIDRIVELCSEHKKIFIVCKYTAEIDRIEAEFKEKLKGRTIITFTGKNSATRPEMAKKTDTMDECIIIANAACSAAYECSTIPLMVLYSYDFSWVNYSQIMARIRRANNPGAKVYISLLMKNSIDIDVMECVKSKKDFDDKIFNP